MVLGGVALLISFFLAERGFVSSWQPKMCKVRNPYSLQYEKDLPWGADIKRQVELDDITDGRPTVLALHTAHCLYCTTQAKYLGNMARDLQGYGVNISIIIINRAGYEDYTDYYMRHIRMFDHVYYMQDSWSTNAWRDLGGYKDDFYIYDAQQRLVKYVTGRTVSLTNFSWRDELYDLLSRMGAGQSPCDDEFIGREEQKSAEIYRSDFAFPTELQCKRLAGKLPSKEVVGFNSVYYFIDGTSYSVGQAFELARYLRDKDNVTLTVVSSIHDLGFYRRFTSDMKQIDGSGVRIVEDRVGEESYFGQLNVFHDDLLLLDESSRLALYSKSPKTDMLNAGWRAEIERFLGQAGDTCDSFQISKLKCETAVNWLYKGDLPFTWYTFERFTVLTILSCGEDGVAQFLAIKEARKKMGHFPITQMAINPQECDNREMLETLERGSRVHLLFDDDGGIVDTLYGSAGDVLFYSKERVLVGRERYTARFDLMNRIRFYYKDGESLTNFCP